eukprot:2107588-Rhodomonas_salina.5
MRAVLLFICAVQYSHALRGTGTCGPVLTSCSVLQRHGRAPQWAIDWCKKHGVSLNFANCNDFVLPKE